MCICAIFLLVAMAHNWHHNRIKGSDKSVTTLLHGLQGLSSFYDGQNLPTLFPNNNLTVMIEETNKTDAIYVISYGSEAEIVTPPAYACNASTSSFG